MISLSTAGESHGPRLVAILEGLPAGLRIDSAAIGADLARRRNPAGAGARMSIENDAVSIAGGVMAGATTGAPVALEIENRDHASWKGREIPAFTVPRPGHADFAAAVKYGYDDLRLAIERASARETAARVAAGACCRAFLRELGVTVRGRVLSIGGVEGDETAPAVADAIAAARADGETLGGVVEVEVRGLPPGIGSHVSAARRLDTRLAAAAMSVNAVKGVEIGGGFALAAMRGTAAQDAILPADGGAIRRASNRAGGIEGGISNGEPVIVRVAFKPIPSTIKPQDSVDLAGGAPAKTVYERSDTCPVPRAVVVVESAVALVVAGAVLEKTGGDCMDEVKSRFAALPRAAFDAARVSPSPKVFW